eukprot:6196362-Pleurochrysis_carterae.AAC.3
MITTITTTASRPRPRSPPPPSPPPPTYLPTYLADTRAITMMHMIITFEDHYRPYLHREKFATGHHAHLQSSEDEVSRKANGRNVLCASATNIIISTI